MPPSATTADNPQERSLRRENGPRNNNRHSSQNQRGDHRPPNQQHSSENNLRLSLAKMMRIGQFSTGQVKDLEFFELIDRLDELTQTNIDL